MILTHLWSSKKVKVSNLVQLGRPQAKFIIIINPLTMRVVGAPQIISQPVSSIFLISLLPSGTWWTPGLSIPLCCLPTSSSVCPVFFALSLCLAKWFSPDLMNGRHVHTTAVCVSLRCPVGLRVIRLPVGSWHGLPRWSLYEMLVSCGNVNTSFPWFVFFFGALLLGSMIHKRTGRWMWQGSASDIVELREMLLSFQTDFILVSAAVVCAIL